MLAGGAVNDLYIYVQLQTIDMGRPVEFGKEIGWHLSTDISLYIFGYIHRAC
jgi:hypothetical protein